MKLSIDEKPGNGRMAPASQHTRSKNGETSGFGVTPGLSDSAVHKTVYTATRTFKPNPKTLRANRVVAADLGKPEAEAFRMLRTQVRRRMQRRGTRTLGICSARNSEGKSLVAMNLAISMSLDMNQTVLLVELDLRHPSLCKLLGHSPKRGLDDYLKGDATIPECLVNPGFERLVVLPARQPLPGASEYLSSPVMGILADELLARYPDRIIIYDMPPVLMTDESIGFMNNLGACLLVVEEGRTGRKDVGRALELLDRDIVIGSVLNKASTLYNKLYSYHYY